MPAKRRTEMIYFSIFSIKNWAFCCFLLMLSVFSQLSDFPFTAFHVPSVEPLFHLLISILSVSIFAFPFTDFHSSLLILAFSFTGFRFSYISALNLVFIISVLKISLLFVFIQRSSCEIGFQVLCPKSACLFTVFHILFIRFLLTFHRFLHDLFSVFKFSSFLSMMGYIYVVIQVTNTDRTCRLTITISAVRNLKRYSFDTCIKNPIFKITVNGKLQKTLEASNLIQ